MFHSLLQLLSKLFAFTGYVSGKESYPHPLSAQEEADCLALFGQGDMDAREKLIKHNLRLVAHIAKKYTQSMDADDLISIGSIGLVKGISTFEVSKGTQLVTYLARCIENEILMALRSSKRYRGVFSLNDPLGVDGEGNEFSLIDVLSVNEDSVFMQVEREIISEKLQKVLKSTLTQREYAIMQMRYGLNGVRVRTQLETATLLGISRSYISRIEKKALKKLNAKINKDDFPL